MGFGNRWYPVPVEKTNGEMHWCVGFIFHTYSFTYCLAHTMCKQICIWKQILTCIDVILKLLSRYYTISQCRRKKLEHFRPFEVWMKFSNNCSQTNYCERWPRQMLLNYLPLNVSGNYGWSFNTGQGNGLVPSWNMTVTESVLLKI